MSYTVVPKFTALIRDDTGGDMDIELVWSLSGTAGVKFQQELVQNANTTVPFPSCTLLCVVPPTDNTQAYTLKGASGDTGIVASAAAIPSGPINVFGLASVILFLAAGSNRTFTFIAL